MRDYAQLTTSFVVFCNRVGVDESISFWGGSEVIAPDRRAGVQRRRSTTRACSSSTSTSPTSAASGSRCRCCATSGRSCVARELAPDRRRAGRARADRRDEPRDWAGATDRAATTARRTGDAGRHGTGAGPGGDGPEPLFELPDGARDRHRRRPRGSIAEFIRGQLAPGRLRAGGPRAVRRHRLGARRLPRRRGDRGGAAAVRADAVPDLVAGLAGGRRGGRRAARLRRRSSSTSAAMVDGYFGPDGAPGAGGADALDASPLRRGNFMARMRMAVLYDRSVTWRGLVVGTGNKTESLIGYTTLFGDSACAFNPIGDLYKSQVRQLVGGDRRARGDHPQGAVGRPVAGPDRRDRGRLHATPSSTASCSGGSTSAGRTDELVALGFDAGDGRAGGPDGRRRRVQAPGPADREARAADGRRRLPLPAPAAGLVGAAVSAARAAATAERPAGRCTSSRRRSATSATSRCGRSRSCAPSR